MSFGWNNSPVDWGAAARAYGNDRSGEYIGAGLNQLGQGLAQGIQGYRERVQKKKDDEQAANLLKSMDDSVLSAILKTEDPTKIEEFKNDPAAIKAAINAAGGSKKFMTSLDEMLSRAQQLEMQGQHYEEIRRANREQERLRMDALAAEIENNRTRNRIAETDSLARLTQYANEASPFRMSAQPVLDPTGSPVVGPDGKPLMSLNTSPRSAMLAPTDGLTGGDRPTASMKDAAAAKAALESGDYLTVVKLIGPAVFPGLQDAAEMGPEEAKKYIKDMAEIWLGKVPTVDPKKNGDEQSQSGGMMTTSSGARWSIKK